MASQVKTASNRTLYFCAFVGCLTGALFGYSVGFIGGILVLPSFLHHFYLDELPADALASATSTTVSAWLVGALIGVPLGMPVCSRLGRKYCLWFCALLYVLGAALQLVGNIGIEVFDLGRLLNGLGVGVGTLVSPMYISEISTPTTRGMLLSGYQTAIQLAALAGFWSAFAAHSSLPNSSPLQWQIPVAVQLCPAILLLLGVFYIQESPRFLAEQGRIDEAEVSLEKLRGRTRDDETIVDEVGELQDTLELAQLKKGVSFWNELREPSLRRKLGVGIGLMIAQNMVGLNALNYYAPTIFMSAGFTSVSSSLFLTGLFGVVKVLSATAFMLVFVHWYGTRFWLKFGSAVCAISMLILAIFVHRMPEPGSSDAVPGLTINGVISVAMVYIFAFAFGISLGPLSWNICSEIFPVHIKTKCCAITTIVQWLFQIVISTLTPHLLAKVGWMTYLLYAICCIISFLWVDSCVPETKGVPLGRSMDKLFISSSKHNGSFVQFVEDIEDVDETTALLSRRAVRERRDSFGFAV